MKKNKQKLPPLYGVATTQLERMNNIKNANEYYSTKEASKILGIPSKEVTRLCKQGRLNARRKTYGTRWFIDKRSVDEYELLNISWYRPYGDIALEYDEYCKPLTFTLAANALKDPRKYETDIPYLVTNKGRIISLKSQTELEQTLSSDHAQVKLMVGGNDVTYKVHRLVALMFCPNRLLKCCVHHIDGNPLNNCADNLIWVTYEEHGKCHQLKKKTDAESVKKYKQYIKMIQKENAWRPGERVVCIPHPDYMSDDSRQYFMYITKEAYDKHQAGATWDVALAPYDTGRGKNRSLQTPIVGEFVK